MKKHFLTLFIIISLVNTTNAQPNINWQEANNTKAKQLVSLLNSNKWDSAYGLFNSKFKNAISIEKWNAVKAQIVSLMPLQTIEFKCIKKNISKFKTNGAGINFQLFVGVDSVQQIEVFTLQPYQEDATKKITAATDNKKQTLLDNTIDTLVGKYINQLNNVGVSVAVLYNGVEQYYNYGETKKGNGILPTFNTAYEIGSITKTFTAALLAKAVIEKKMALTDAITKYLPDSVAANALLQNITVQQLSNHSSGFPRVPLSMNFTVTNQNQPYENFSNNHLFSFLKNYTGYKKPNNQYDYSNLAVGLLGVILESVFKDSFENLVKKFIANPLKMKNTNITLKDSSLLAQGYNDENTPTPTWNFLSLSAAGSIKSTTADLMKYGKAQLEYNNTTISKIFALTHKVTLTKDDKTVALGWHIDNTRNNTAYLHHSGGTYGCRSMLAIIPSKKMVVVVLANNATTGDVLGIQLVEAIANLQ
jgi:CubicO group peptidase (beta-lactamase class C family)